MRLINANELEDLFLYGIDDMSVLGDQAQDQRVIDLIRQQQTIKTVPFYEIAKAILKIRSINPDFEYIPRKEIIDILWRLIDDKEVSDES
ncbi:MAG: hypothetical protein IIZ78_00965 [Clostridiales bacterium]|nr:hypothetical protein [Clostridiales bacterium]